MSGASRKAKRNLGGTDRLEIPATEPVLAAARTNIVLVERILQTVLKTEIDRLALKANQDELVRFFSHFYDPIAGAVERARFVTNFQKEPPKATIGYPRTTATVPCFSIILESEEETQNLLDDYVGQTLPGEDAVEAAEYQGAIFTQTYGIYIYAQHPDVVAYLYQFAKLTLFGAKAFLIQAGLIEPHFSGGELNPNEVYLPDNMFGRVLRITANAVISVPVLVDPDPLRVKLAGLFMDDIVVDGIRGGVTAVDDIDE